MIKKRFFAALICAMLLITLLPTTAFADETDETPIDYTLYCNPDKGTLHKKSGDTVGDQYTDHKDKWSVTGEAPNVTLTLNNFKFTTSAAIALELDNVSELVLEGNSEVTSTSNSTGSFAVYCNGPLTIRGTGTLTATGGTSESSNSLGVSAEGGITVNGGNIIGKGGAASNNSYGVHSGSGGITVSNGGSIEGTGGTSGTSYGVYASNGITVESDGSIIGTGGTATSSSYGVYANNGITVKNGCSIKGTGAVTSNNGSLSYGVYVENKNINASGGSIEGTGPDVAKKGAKSYGVFADKSIIVENGGTIKSTGGVASEVDTKSFGMHCNGDITISDGTVSAEGGTASGDYRASYGMSAGGCINVSAGTVLARGYSAALKSNTFVPYKVPTVSLDIGGSPTVPFDLKSLSTYKYLRITPITSVNVSPVTASVEKGSTQRFSAAVTGTNEPAQTVTWSVEGNNSASTAINANGVLTVGSDETATTLTVKATSTVDTEKFGTATVTVMPKFVPVDDLIRGFLPSVAVNTDLNLCGTVEPANATHQTVAWSMKNAGSTGATITNGVFRATAVGEATVTATIVNGTAETTNYTKDFTVTVTSKPAPKGGVSSSISGGSVAMGNVYTGSLTAGANGAFVLTVQADCEKLTSVTVDGVQLTREKDYTAVSGSTIITLSPAYLASLKDGVHTVRVQFTDGRYDGTFITPRSAAIAAAAVADVPATGGDTVPALWLGAALLGLVASLAIRRKRQNG